MTDRELIQLVDEKTPGEMSTAEVELIRQRMESCPELREAVLAQVRFEQRLNQTLGRVHVSADQVFALSRMYESPANRIAALFGWPLRSALLLFVALTLWLIYAPPKTPSTAMEAEAVIPEQKSDAIKLAAQPAADTAPAAKPADKVVPVVPTLDARDGKHGSKHAPAVARRSHPRRSAQELLAGRKENNDGRQALTAVSAADNAVTPEEWPELAQHLKPRPFVETCFAGLSEGRDGLGANELRRWLAPVPGYTHRFVEKVSGRQNLRVAGFEGLSKLKAPWIADGVLCLAPFEHEGFSIYFWNGLQGVAIFGYTGHRQSWAAYSVGRDGREPRPSSYALVASDEDRYERSFCGPIEIRHQEGAIVVSRGDLRLLTAPLASAPAEVYFDNRAWFRSISMYRGEPIPDDADESAPNLLATNQPSSLNWLTTLPSGAQLVKHDDEVIELTAERTAESARAGVQIPRAGLHEIIFQVENAGPGAGIYLGDAAGRPVHRLGFFREGRTGWTTFGFLKPNENRVASQFNLQSEATPLLGQRHWLRLIVGAGTCKCWTSGDGVHWSRAVEPLRGVGGGYAQVGVYCSRTDKPISIALRRIEVRELQLLTGLGRGDLRDSIPTTVSTCKADFSTWMTRVLESQPAGISSHEWRQACAIRSLAEIPAAGLGNMLLNGLLEDNLFQPSPIEGRLRLLDQAVELSDCWEQPECYRFTQFYERLGKSVLRDDQARPYSLVGHAVLAAPLSTRANFQTLPESLVRAELLRCVYDDNWTEVSTLCRRLKFWSQCNNPATPLPQHRLHVKNLVDWAEATATRMLATQQHVAAPRPLPSAWRQPLVVELSKEGFNTLAEVESALAEEAYRDACQIISSARPELALGLLSTPHDDKLLVSFPLAVAGAMRDHPVLSQTMADQFSPLAWLRVRKGIADANPLTLKAATIQFYGTEAAAEAHVWLGDRALLEDDSPTAISEFTAALRTAGAEQRPALLARMRLAAAIAGSDTGEPVDVDVSINGISLTAADFEKLIAEKKQLALRKVVALPGGLLIDPVKPGQTDNLIASVGFTPPVSTKHGRYVSHALARWQTAKIPPASTTARWTREIASQLDENVLYVSDVQRIAAFDLAASRWKWSQASLSDKELLGLPHAELPMQSTPVVAGDRVYARRLTKTGYELACLEKATGKPLWNVRPGGEVVSDPQFAWNELLAVTATPTTEGYLQLMLTRFDAQTGDVAAQSPLIKLLNRWHGHVPCRMAVSGGRIVLVAGGNVLSCDLRGHVQWVRKQTWIPSAHDSSSAEQDAALLLLPGGNVVVANPGVRSLECLNAESGRRVWQRSLPDLRRLLGSTGGRVIVETSQGLLALAADTGRPVWEQAVDQMLTAQLCSSTGEIVYTCREAHKPDASILALVWLNAETGRETAYWPIPACVGSQPQLSPLIAGKTGLLAFFAPHATETNLELVELTPTAGAPYQSSAAAPPLAHWTEPTVDERIQRATTAVLPGWVCLAGGNDARCGWQPAVQGETDVCVTMATHERPVVFAREISIPGGAPAKLALQVGHEPGEKWALDIRIANRSLQTHLVDTQGAEPGWKQWEVDLSAYAGQTVWLIVEQQHYGKPARGYWKQLDVRY